MIRVVPPEGLPPEETVGDFIKGLNFDDSSWVAVLTSVDGELMLHVMGVEAGELHFSLAKMQQWLVDNF